MIIGIDLDSTLNDLEVGWIEWINKTHDPDFAIHHLTQWGWHEVCVARDAIYDYIEIPGVFRNAAVRPDAQRVVTALQNQGHRIIVVTACNHNPRRGHVMAEKIEWIADHFPSIDPSDICFVNNKSLMRLDLLLDDGLHNLETCHGRPIVFDQPWNRHDNQIERVHGWEGFETWCRQNELLKST